MSKLEPGMLALVIRARNSDNLGRVVETVRRVAEGEDIKEIPWGITTLDGWLITGNLVINGVERSYGTIRGEFLLPIPPLSDPLETKQEQELHA